MAMVSATVFDACEAWVVCAPHCYCLLLSESVYLFAGTQEIFDSDDRVLYLSIHRYDGEFYPR